MQSFIRTIHFIAWVLALVTLAGCGSPAPIRIGFTAQLTGRGANLGVHSRNGTQLAIDQINRGGGVAGRPLELVTRDDAGDKDQLIQADSELIDSGVVALTGHTSGWEALAAKPLVDKYGVFLVSPASSTSGLTGLHDHVIRMIPGNDAQAAALARHAYQNLHLKTAVILLDEDNLAFTQSFNDIFTATFKHLGGRVVAEIGYSATTQPAYRPLVSEAQALQPDLLLVNAAGMDTAFIAQQARQMNWNVQIMTANWAYTQDLLQNGGSAVEGLVLTSFTDEDCRDPDYLAFRDSYLTTFGQEPESTAQYSYEAVYVLARALEQTRGKTAGLREALAKAQDIKSLCGWTHIDANGDSTRDLHLLTIRDGRYVLGQSIPPGTQP